jgi:hypothetical protein
MCIKDPGTSVPAVSVIRIPLFPEMVDNCAVSGAFVQVLPTVVASHSASETYSLGACAVAVMTSLLAKAGLMELSVQTPELTVVVPINILLLYTRMVVPLGSVEVPETLVAPEFIGALMLGHKDRSVQFDVFGEQKP